MYRPSDDDIAELRRQQAAFGKVEHDLARQNSWMAIPALAPVAAIFGLEAASALAAEAAPAAAEQAPLDFVESDPYVRVGDNWATRAGRRAHKAFGNKVDAKLGWESEPQIPRPGQRPLRPDAGTPARDPAQPDKRNFLELKPDTPTGRAAGARSVRRYQEATGRRARVVYYDPKDFI
jgi:hypothetical protein